MPDEPKIKHPVALLEDLLKLNIGVDSGRYIVTAELGRLVLHRKHDVAPGTPVVLELNADSINNGLYGRQWDEAENKIRMLRLAGVLLE